MYNVESKQHFKRSNGDLTCPRRRQEAAQLLQAAATRSVELDATCYALVMNLENEKKELLSELLLQVRQKTLKLLSGISGAKRPILCLEQAKGMPFEDPMHAFVSRGGSSSGRREMVSSEKCGAVVMKALDIVN